ncbi:MAG: ABC transporter ATP-binding protein [Oligoflexia bacterium]|nr:ABC transporter ATP-binding protein [Oligoflexia bacterium]
MNPDILRTENIIKTYKSGEIEVEALKGVNISIKKGEFTAIAGPSGSGKSTFLNLLSGLDRPTKGVVYLKEKPISEMSGNQLSDFRRDHIGFIFQSYNLIPVLTVKENIEYIMLIQGISEGERKKRVNDILHAVGLMGMEKRRPSQLSGGQQQRVAIARAVVSRPDVILADEPTANLDSETANNLIDMMRSLNETKGITFLFSTHDKKIMDRSKRLIILKDGRIDSDKGLPDQLSL